MVGKEEGEGGLFKRKRLPTAFLYPFIGLVLMSMVQKEIDTGQTQTKKQLE